MKTSLSLDYRMTTGYVLGWKHLDEHAYVCIAQHTKPRTLRGAEDDESATQQAVVTISPQALEAAKANYRQVRNHTGLTLTFSQFMRRAVGAAFSDGCQCEHDCCGCWQYHGSAEQTKRREFVVTINCYRNV
jgi:hypothetical protein